MGKVIIALSIALTLVGCSTIKKSTGAALDPVTEAPYNVEKITE